MAYCLPRPPPAPVTTTTLLSNLNSEDILCVTGKFRDRDINKSVGSLRVFKYRCSTNASVEWGRDEVTEVNKHLGAGICNNELLYTRFPAYARISIAYPRKRGPTEAEPGQGPLSAQYGIQFPLRGYKVDLHGHCMCVHPPMVTHLGLNKLETNSLIGALYL